MAFVLWFVAVLMVVFGVVRLCKRDFLWGTVLIAAGLLIGGIGGVSPF